MPNRYISNGEVKQAALLFPGTGMRASGIGSLYPSPHGAIPVKRRRHTLIAFLIDLDLEPEQLEHGQQ